MTLSGRLDGGHGFATGASEWHRPAMRSPAPAQPLFKDIALWYFAHAKKPTAE